MRYLDKIREEYLMRMVETYGYEGAAQKLNMPMKEFHKQITLLYYKYSSETFAHDTLTILDKNGNLIPFHYNKGQKIIAAAKEKQLLAGKPVRICLLKARQFGGSTLEEGDVFRECMLKMGRSTMIIAHDLDSARHLREMSERFYLNYPLHKPALKRETDKWWRFIHMGKKIHASNLRIDTAEELSTGHSLTLHHLHLSEIQNWRNAAVLVKGLFPTVPSNPDTTIFMEGTGSGVGDYWYDFCQMAMSKETDWEFVFVPWYNVETYEAKFATPDERSDFEASLDSEEKLLSHQSVSLEQLHWRRIKVRDDYKGDYDSFRQQYPADPDEAFLTSGRPVFPMMKVRENMFRSRKPVKIGNLRWKDGKIKFDEQEKGLWEIWEEPERETENLYCLGADVAEGIAVIPELGNKGGDFSVAKIFRRDTRRMVARLRERLDPDIFAEEIHKISLYYGRVGILVENNPGGSGNVVIRDLKEIPGLNLLKTVTIDRVHDTRKEQFGWDTNKESKRELIDELNELIREESFTDWSCNLWAECSTYVRDEKGKTNAQLRKYDDEVIATALCFQADKLMPMVFRKKDDVPEEPEDRGKDMGLKKRGKEFSQESVMDETYGNF